MNSQISFSLIFLRLSNMEFYIWYCVHESTTWWQNIQRWKSQIMKIHRLYAMDFYRFSNPIHGFLSQNPSFLFRNKHLTQVLRLLVWFGFLWDFKIHGLAGIWNFPWIFGFFVSISSKIKKPTTVTQQLTKSRDFRQNLCDFHLSMENYPDPHRYCNTGYVWAQWRHPIQLTFIN